MAAGTDDWTPYCGPAAMPADLLARWNLDPALLLTLAIAGVVLWRRSAPATAWSALCVLVVIFVSPLCALSSALFSARTVHHVLLVAVAAPLAAWSVPTARPRNLPLATILAATVFWAWHAPAAYTWALASDAGYWLMQASLAATGLWFWMAMRSARPLAAVSALLVSTVQMGLLGALLTVAGQPVYAPHAATTWAWGLTPLQDQQAAGLIMWVPAAAIYLSVGLAILGRRLAPSPAT